MAIATLIATWLLAAATAALAVEGATALRGWFTHLGLTRRRQELDEIRRQITLLQHAVWMKSAGAGQGSAAELDEKVRTILTLDGWQPDMELAAQAGYFSMDRLQDDAPGVTGE